MSDAADWPAGRGLLRAAIMIRRLLSLLGIEKRATPTTSSLHFEPHEGQLLSVPTEGGKYGVLKVLAVDQGGIHARLYVQRFHERPVESDLGELTTAAFGPPFSIGHIPLSHATFAGYSPRLICTRAVLDEELEGYRMWQDAEGGYF